MSDILFNLSEQRYTHSPEQTVAKERLIFDVDENGECMVGTDRGLMDVNEAAQLILRPIIQAIHSGT
jgi:hypothetical protein